MGSTLLNKSPTSSPGTTGRTSAKRKAKITRCSDCGFKSTRAFNVVRHYERIHEPAKRQLECCGKRWLTKGQLYQHYADVHPESRRLSIVSTTKYRITTTVKKDKLQRRRSSRHVKPKTEKEDFYLDEDTPLINYVNNFKAIKKELIKEELDVKMEDHSEFDAKNCIEIFFKGDTASPLHVKIQQEFLRNIDFEIFKIV